MVVFYTDEDLTEEARGVALEEVTWAHLKEHKQGAALPAESVYFVREGQMPKSLKERTTPNSSLILSALLASSDAIS